MPVCSTVNLLPLGTIDDLMHYCTRPSALGNSASGRPRHLGVIVWTILQTCMKYLYYITRERSGSVVECLTRDRRVAGSSLTGVTALWSLSKTHLS